ncbi:MAG: DUF4147 domain-containing protein [Balneolales bacterium]
MATEIEVEKYRNQREEVKRLFLHGLAAVAPEKIIRSAVTSEDNVLTICDRSYTLTDDRRVWVFGSGKAAGRMALELEQILGTIIYDGIVICPYGLKTATRRIQQFEAAHPVPDLNSLTATYELLDVASNVHEGDLVIYLLSGGTSSLLFMPHNKLDMEDVRALQRHLLVCGADIHDINRIRKSLSQVKGGKLRKVFGRAIVEMLAISDVPGNDPAVIGSGPLVDDPVSPGEALELLYKHKMDEKIPPSIIKFLESEQRDASSGESSIKQFSTSVASSVHNDVNAEKKNKVNLQDKTPGDMPGFKTYVNILASAEKVAEAIKYGAISLGYHAHVTERFLTGEARKVAQQIVEEGVNVLVKDFPVSKPAALIWYGETTVTVKGKGKGGRNQELALSAVLSLEGRHYITLLSGGTDGRDGETNAAGAICNGQSAIDARNAGYVPESYLENNDSWHFFKYTDGLLVTGVTGNNLMDIQIMLIEP